jgi:hypothetical protein
MRRTLADVGHEILLDRALNASDIAGEVCR